MRVKRRGGETTETFEKLSVLQKKEAHVKLETKEPLLLKRLVLLKGIQIF